MFIYIFFSLFVFVFCPLSFLRLLWLYDCLLSALALYMPMRDDRTNQSRYGAERHVQARPGRAPPCCVLQSTLYCSQM